MSSQIENWLICPDCKTPLSYSKDSFKCIKCKRKFKKEKGIWLLSSSNKGYEWSKIDLPTLLGDRGRVYRDFYDFFDNNKEIFRGNILELGADLGGISAIIKDKAKVETVIATDIANNILRSSTKVAPVLGESPDFIIQCDAEHLPFRDNLFDVVIESSVIHHTILHKSIKEISRVLKKDGFFVGLREPLGNFFTKPIYKKFFGSRTCKTEIYSASEYKRELRKNQFENIQIIFYKEPRWMYPKFLDMLYYNIVKLVPNPVIEKVLLGKARIVAKKD